MGYTVAMAEAFSIAAGILVVLKATKTVISIIGAMKDCLREYSKMLVELSMTAGLLDKSPIPAGDRYAQAQVDNGKCLKSISRVQLMNLRAL